MPAAPPVPASTPRGIRYQRAGQGEPLVLIHGLGSEGRAWAPVVPLLAARHDVIVLDLPGFGASPVLADGTVPSPAALARAVADLFDGLALPDGTAHLVGNSLGGWVALELARQGRARSVVAISPAGFAPPVALHAAVLYLRTVRKLAPLLPDSLLGVPWLRAALLRRFYGKPLAAPLAEVLAANAAFAHCPGFPATTAAAVAAGGFEGGEAIRCPVTLLWGDLDRLLPPSQADRALARLPGARLVRLPGLGHTPMWDDPAGVAQAILSAIPVLAVPEGLRLASG